MYSLMNSCPDIGTVFAEFEVGLICVLRVPIPLLESHFTEKRPNVNRLKGKLPLVSPTNVGFQKRPVQDEGESTRDIKGRISTYEVHNNQSRKPAFRSGSCSPKL